ncbi:MAG: hypothetical protein JXX14_03200, partial [Deltaproteobacteria bacterium]|nr:hypothetical protein [Deltaproteobacteria bacterium]
MLRELQIIHFKIKVGGKYLWILLMLVSITTMVACDSVKTAWDSDTATSDSDTGTGEDSNSVDTEDSSHDANTDTNTDNDTDSQSGAGSDTESGTGAGEDSETVLPTDSNAPQDTDTWADTGTGPDSGSDIDSDTGPAEAFKDPLDCDTDSVVYDSFHRMIGAPMLFAPTATGFGVTVALETGDPRTLSLQIRREGAVQWGTKRAPVVPAECPDRKSARWVLTGLSPATVYEYRVFGNPANELDTDTAVA